MKFGTLPERKMIESYLLRKLALDIPVTSKCCHLFHIARLGSSHVLNAITKKSATYLVYIYDKRKVRNFLPVTC